LQPHLTTPEIILAANIVRYRNLIAHEIDPELRARLEEALARDLQTQKDRPAVEEAT
jgi:hypothetical protein